MVAPHHVDIRHVGKAKLKVGARIVQSGRIKLPAIHDRHDLPAREESSPLRQAP